MIEVYIQEEQFNTQEIINYIESKRLSGAMVSFVGSVRGESSNKSIKIYEFEETPVISNYLFTLNAGPYKIYKH